MAWDVIESKKNVEGVNGIKDAISTWESSVNPTSIDSVETTVLGRDRVAITLIYTV